MAGGQLGSPLTKYNKSDWTLILLLIALAVVILVLMALVISAPVTEPPKIPAYK